MLKIYYKLLFYFLIFLSILSSISAIIYKLYKLNNLSIAFALIISFFVLIIIIKKKQRTNPLNLENQEDEKSNIFYLAPYFVFTIHCFFILFQTQTDLSIISPWELIPKHFFLIFSLSNIFLIINILKKSKLSLLLISLQYFLFFSIALIIYKIGYGFDPFVHRSTMELINEKTTINPKPFYYLGYYSLIIILHKITFVSINLLDKLFVPLLASIYLPILSYSLLKNWFTENKLIYLSIFAFLIFPMSFFIVSTPQSLAYLFLIFVIILGLNCNSLIDLIIIFLFSLSSFFIHPIAGIPALSFAVLLGIYHNDWKQKLKNYFYFLFFIANLLAIPLAFIFGANINNNQSLLNWSNVLSALELNNRIPNSENFVLNAVYLYIFNFNFLILIFIISGLIITFYYKDNCKIFFIYFLSSISLFISFVISQAINFDVLIDYEKLNYSKRILSISLFFLIPFFYISLFGIIKKISLSNKAIISIFIISFLVLLNFSLYATYPRLDNYHNNHGYSVSKNDLEVVDFIANDSLTKDYIVLANQQVSAGSLVRHGFAKYYKNDIFYYPIPTGAPLYKYYLQMVDEKPTRKTMLEAMELAGVDKGYFVLNKYWWAFPKLLEEAKLEADSYEKLANGEIFVFRFSK